SLSVRRAAASGWPCRHQERRLVGDRRRATTEEGRGKEAGVGQGSGQEIAGQEGGEEGRKEGRNEKAGGQTGGKEESGQEEGREKGGQEVGRQTQTRRQAARQKEKGDREEIGGKEKRGQEKEARKEEKKQSLTLRYCCVGAASLTRRLDEGRSDLDLGAEFHHLPGRHAEERGGAFGVALQEGEHGFPPDPH